MRTFSCAIVLTEYVITYRYILVVVFKFLAFLNNHSENSSKGCVHINLLIKFEKKCTTL
jgi:hypothetical protein